jgi:hypothetical protein
MEERKGSRTGLVALIANSILAFLGKEGAASEWALETLANRAS